MATSCISQQAFVAAATSSKAGPRRRILVVRAAAQPEAAAASRRDALRQAAGLAAAALLSRAAPALAEEDAPPTLCDAACAAELDSLPRVTTPSGLQYVDLVKGRGASPPKGFQVTVDYVAMTPNGRVFDSSLEKGYPYQIRVGAGQIVAGLDEGLLSMSTGGVRRLYIPGELAFPKGLPAAAGRPRVPPSSPVVFDVALRYIPGITDEDEE